MDAPPWAAAAPAGGRWLVGWPGWARQRGGYGPRCLQWGRALPARPEDELVLIPWPWGPRALRPVSPGDPACQPRCWEGAVGGRPRTWSQGGARAGRFAGRWTGSGDRAGAGCLQGAAAGDQKIKTSCRLVPIGSPVRARHLPAFFQSILFFATAPKNQGLHGPLFGGAREADSRPGLSKKGVFQCALLFGPAASSPPPSPEPGPAPPTRPQQGQLEGAVAAPNLGKNPQWAPCRTRAKTSTPTIWVPAWGKRGGARRPPPEGCRRPAPAMGDERPAAAILHEDGGQARGGPVGAKVQGTGAKGTSPTRKSARGQKPARSRLGPD